MQAFKTFFKITRHYLGSIVVYFIIFFIICMISVGSQGSTPSFDFTSKKVDLAIIDRDHSTYSKDLAHYLGSLHNIKDVKDDTEVLQSELYHRNVDYILIIPKGYSTQLSAGKFDNLLQNVKVPMSYSGTFVDGQIDHYLQTLKTYLSAGYDETQAFSATSSSLKQSVKVDLLSESSKKDASTNFLHFYQYFAYVILCIIITGLGPILFSYRQKDVAARIHASSFSLKRQNLTLLGSSAVFSLICWAIFVAVSAVVYPSQFFSTVGLLCLCNSFLFLMIAASITFLVSSLAKSYNLFSIMANVVGLGMSFLCGIFVPSEIMSKGVLTVAHALPAYWYMDAHNHFAEYAAVGTGLSSIAAAFGIELVFFGAFVGIGFLLTKVKQTNA